VSAKPSLIDNFKALPAGTRNGSILGVIVLCMFVYGTMNDSGQKSTVKKKEQKDSFTVANPGSTQATEGIASTLSIEQKKTQDLEQQVELLKLQNKQMIEGSSVDGKWSEIATLTAQLQELKQRMDNGGIQPTQPGHKGSAPDAYSGHRDHPFRSIVTTHSGLS
jgi:hypothetical protein